jgi:hypothetical protein
MDPDPPDPATLNPTTMAYRQLQKACKDIGLPGTGTTEVLRQRVQDYVNDPKGVLERLRLSKEEEEKRKREAKALWVDWLNHPAREILLEDLERGGWLYGLEWDARILFDAYQAKQEEFKDVPFDQFAERYKDAKKKATKRRARSAQEEEWLARDRLLHPRQTHNHRGEPVFDMDTAAKEQLRDDVKNELHKHMDPMELWEHREVYAKYKLDKFRQCIYQGIRRGKMLNWLEKERTKKRMEYMTKKMKAATLK